MVFRGGGMMICPIKMINPKENQNMGCLEKDCAWFIESVDGIGINKCALKVLAQWQIRIYWDSNEK